MRRYQILCIILVLMTVMNISALVQGKRNYLTVNPSFEQKYFTEISYNVKEHDFYRYFGFPNQIYIKDAIGWHFTDIPDLSFSEDASSIVKRAFLYKSTGFLANLCFGCIYSEMLIVFDGDGNIINYYDGSVNFLLNPNLNPDARILSLLEKYD